MAITLQVGDKAPLFEGIDQNGNTHTLAQYLGKKVVVFFYPADDTPGCTKEACSLRDSYAELSAKGLQLLGISPDDIASHKKFAEKYNLPFPLLADENKTILQAYGAWGEKNLYGKISVGVLRSTFIIDEKGNIERVIKRVDTKAAAEQLLKGL